MTAKNGRIFPENTSFDIAFNNGNKRCILTANNGESVVMPCANLFRFFDEFKRPSLLDLFEGGRQRKFLTLTGATVFDALAWDNEGAPTWLHALGEDIFFH